MASTVEIWNVALISLGVDRVMDPLEETEGARKCNAIYNTLLEDELASHPWNFAIRRRSLALTSDAVVFGYANSFQLPTNCLRVLALSPQYEYKIEGDRLVTDAGTADILYVQKIDDPNSMPAYFRNLMANRIRYELAFSLTDSATSVERFFALYETTKRQAKAIDAQEGTPAKLFSDRWVTARLGGVE